MLSLFLNVLFFLLAVIFIYSLPLPKWRTCEIAPIKIYFLLWVVFCVMISRVNDRIYESLLQFNTTRFFISNAFFNLASVLLIFFMTCSFMLYICDLFFIFSLIFILINHITSLKQTHLIFVYFLEHLFLYFLEHGLDGESK